MNSRNIHKEAEIANPDSGPFDAFLLRAPSFEKLGSLGARPAGKQSKLGFAAFHPAQ
jgi:hypothetical protein